MIFRRVIRFGGGAHARAGAARGLALPFGLLAGTDDEPDYELLDEFASGGQLPFGFLSAAIHAPVEELAGRAPGLTFSRGQVPAAVRTFVDPIRVRAPASVPFSPAPIPAPPSFEGHDIFRDVVPAPDPGFLGDDGGGRRPELI